jgi:hypothetical protein
MDRLHPEILFKKDEAMPLTLKQGKLTDNWLRVLLIGVTS